MNIFDYNINCDFIYSKYVILFAFLLFIFLFMMFVICSFCVVKLLQIGFEHYNVFFYQYNKKCQKIIDEYGNCKINKIYLVRQPISKLVSIVTNIFTLFNYNEYITKSPDNYPYHPAIIFEIKHGNLVKFLLVEKNNCINICESFLINKTYEFKSIDIPKNKYTLTKILKKTKKRIGNHKYFNWNMYKNNCQEFTKEILITLNKYSEEYKHFIFSDKFMKHYYSPSDFTLHIINCLFIVINFIEKYIFDNNIFY